MPEGVAEVEQHAVAGLRLVAGDDGGLGGDAALDGLGQHARIVAVKQALPMAVEPLEERRASPSRPYFTTSA